MDIEKILKENQVGLFDNVVDANVIISRIERYVAILKEYKGLILSAYNDDTDLISLNLAIEYTMADFDLKESDLLKAIEGYEF